MKKVISMLLAANLVFSIMGCGAAPAQEAAPIEETAPTEETAPSEKTAPAEESAAPAREPITDRPIKIGLVLSDLSIPIFVEATESIKKVAEENGDEFIAWDSKGEVNKLIEGIENFKASGCDVIFVQNWVGGDTILPFIEECVEQNNAIILSYDSILDIADYNLLADLQGVGEAMAEQAAKWMKENHEGKGTIVVATNTSSEFVNVRTDAMIQKLEELVPDCDILTFDGNNYSPGVTGGLDMCEQMFAAAPDAKCIVSTWGASYAVGFYQGLQAAGITREKDKVAILTCDGSSDEFEAIKDDDTFWCTINLDLVNQMTQLYERGVNYAKTGVFNEDEEIMYFPMIPVTYENLDEYYQR